MRRFELQGNDVVKDGKINCLIVEDDREGGLALQMGLEEKNFNVTLVSSAEEAIQIFRPGLWDVVLADIRLKGMSGVGLLEYLRCEYDLVPVILLTAFENLSTAIKAVKLGAQDYIIKPAESIDFIVASLEKAVRNYHLLQQKTALEGMLKKNEARFRELIECSRDISFRVDLSGASFDYISPIVTSVLGGSRDSYLGLSFMDGVKLVHLSDMDAFLLWCESARNAIPWRDADEFAVPKEVRVMHVDGSYRWLSIACKIIFDAETGKAAAVVGAARDVTTQKKMEGEARLERENYLRSERVKSLSVLAAGVAHDLKNILYTSTIIPDLLLKRFAKVKEFDDRQKIITDCVMMRDSVKQAADLVQDLMTISGASKCELIPLDLNVLVADYLEMAGRYRIEVSPSRIELRKELSPGSLPVMGYPLHLHRVLMNLVSNACEAMVDGGVLTISTARVHPEHELQGYAMMIPQGEYAVLCVSDSGGGIPENIIEKIFEPFFTTTAKKKGGSSGLGLSIVRGIVADHGGYIDVKSEAGKGARFIVYLPAARVDAVKPASLKAESVKAEGMVMLVDDLPQELSVRERMLAALGFKVVTARNGHEAVEIFKMYYAGNKSGQPPFEFVFLDVNMEPDFDGFDTFRQIAFVCPEQQCILTTAFGAPARIKEAASLGIVECVPKPMSMDELCRLVARVMPGKDVAGEERITSREMS